ncbi:hypothetical protein HV356_07460 [Citrobacter sp. RHBSTW-01065]|nr:hypothetical protein [Citrobacter sp. RHBSTW-01065]
MATDGQVADDTDTLLAMMGFSSVDVTETGEITSFELSRTIPERHSGNGWLHGCRSGSLYPEQG